MQTLIVYIFILGVIIFIHELGHYIFAKRAGVYVYEFSLGMGPRLFKKTFPNNETEYSIRAIPIGGYVQLAGEEVNNDIDIPEDKKLYSKTWGQRFLTIVAGVTFNFIFAIILLIIMGFLYGSKEISPALDNLNESYPVFQSGIVNGDTILAVNNKNVGSIDETIIILSKSKTEMIDLEIKKLDGTTMTYSIIPIKEIIDEEERLVYGITFSDKKYYGFINTFKYAFWEFGVLIKTMFIVISSLFVGSIGLNNIAGPVGIFTVLDGVSGSIHAIMYFLVLFSVNVGFINLIPFPAFDGGRLLFLVIEKIKGSKVNPKIENIFHTIGFLLLLLLMIVITFQDIVRIFN